MEKKYINSLIHEKSPYLLQHAYNPVNWYPWGDEALNKAKSENKPIFLSIGYSACHWCHVMERESFEDTQVAQFLNEHFISIKVDREERPDIDHIYMKACQLITGAGGWPLSVFLTPDRQPFYAGTYFPKHDSRGMPGFLTVLSSIKNAWEQDTKGIFDSAQTILAAIAQKTKSTGILAEDAVHNAYNMLEKAFDKEYGGFGKSPKFPVFHNIMFLLRYYKQYNEPRALQMVEKTLNSIFQGGIYDHIGYGLCRYSTDNKWLVPHFEKMLYDNAMAAYALTEAYLATGNRHYANLTRDILTFVLRDMTSPEGGFYTAWDADSEGKEGAYYIFTPQEVIEAIGKADATKYMGYYDITEKGNFEGYSIPNLINKQIPENDLLWARQMNIKLLKYREKRQKPFRDEKQLTSLNGLMIAAMAKAGNALNDASLIAAATRAAKLIKDKLFDKSGLLYERYKDGEAAIYAFLDGYAFYTRALIELYEATFNTDYLRQSLSLSQEMLKHFWDSDEGGLYLYGNHAEQQITRPKDAHDAAIPSGNSVAAEVLIRLAAITEKQELEQKAIELFNSFENEVSDYPAGYCYLLSALLSQIHGTVRVAFSGLSDELINSVRYSFNPFVAVVYLPQDNSLTDILPDYARQTPPTDSPTAYVCKHGSCLPPTESAEALTEILRG